MMRKLLITGGTGTLGQAILSYSNWDGRFVSLSRGEQKIDALRNLGLPNTRFIQGDVADIEKVRMAVRDVDTIVVAHANKIVPGGAYNPDEFVRVNISGTLNVFRCAIEAGVRQVLFISTDKACNPANLYGATKMVGEHLAIQMNDWSEQTTIGVVRYGNVIGSRGSFTLACDAWRPGDAPLKITDPESTRFWISQRKAVAFIDMVLDRLEGGAIYVPKLESRRLIDTLPQGCRFEVTGWRAFGEKKDETLVAEHELEHCTDMGSYFIIRPYRKGDNALKEPYCSTGSRAPIPATPSGEDSGEGPSLAEGESGVGSPELA